MRSRPGSRRSPARSVSAASSGASRSTSSAASSAEALASPGAPANACPGIRLGRRRDRRGACAAPRARPARRLLSGDWANACVDLLFGRVEIVAGHQQLRLAHPRLDQVGVQFQRTGIVRERLAILARPLLDPPEQIPGLGVLVVDLQRVLQLEPRARVVAGLEQFLALGEIGLLARPEVIAAGRRQADETSNSAAISVRSIFRSFKTDSDLRFKKDSPMMLPDSLHRFAERWPRQSGGTIPRSARIDSVASMDRRGTRHHRAGRSLSIISAGIEQQQGLDQHGADAQRLDQRHIRDDGHDQDHQHVERVETETSSRRNAARAPGITQ